VGGTDLRQENSHRFGIHDRADPPVQFARLRADRAVNLLKFPFVTVGHHGPLRGGGPAASNPHHPAKAGLGLKHQANVTPLDRILCQQGCQRFGEFFPTPPAPRVCSWDGACPRPLCASRGVPTSATRRLPALTCHTHPAYSVIEEIVEGFVESFLNSGWILLIRNPDELANPLPPKHRRLLGRSPATRFNFGPSRPVDTPCHQDSKDQ
jgi:hypothetical protein